MYLFELIHGNVWSFPFQGTAVGKPRTLQMGIHKIRIHKINEQGEMEKFLGRCGRFYFHPPSRTSFLNKGYRARYRTGVRWKLDYQVITGGKGWRAGQELTLLLTLLFYRGNNFQYWENERGSHLIIKPSPFFFNFLLIFPKRIFTCKGFFYRSPSPPLASSHFGSSGRRWRSRLRRGRSSRVDGEGKFSSHLRRKAVAFLSFTLIISIRPGKLP